MRFEILRAGLWAGAVTAAATVGALIAIGHRIGRAALPLGTIGAFVAGRHAFLFGDPATTRDLLVGTVVQVGICIAWAVLTAWLVLDRRARLGWTVLAVAVADFVMSWIFARATGNGLATVVPLGFRIDLAVVLGASLFAGIRLALSSPREWRA